MHAGFMKRNSVKLMVAVAAATVAITASVCNAQVHPDMHAAPVGHSRPDAAPDSHEECVLKAIRVDAPSIDQSALFILAIADVPDLPLIGAKSSFVHTFGDFREPLVGLFPTHERSPPVPFLS